MARRKTKKRKTRRAKSAPMPGWIWMLFGLAVGLSVAGAIYINDRQTTGAESTKPASVPASAKRSVKGEASGSPKEKKYTFYDLLPNFEVIVPEEDVEARPDVKSDPVTTPGIYVLQAGSYTNYSDADRVKAQLAMLGIVSGIQKVSIDDRAYHRVRVGPFDSLEKLNGQRQKLREANIDFLLVKIGG
jgi:cell division protein FtsN